MQAANGKPLRLYCPMNLHPSEILAPDDVRYGDGIIYLCHAIMTRRVQDPRFRKGHRAGFVGLKTQYLRNVIGRHNLAKVKELAIRNGVVQCEESYQAGKQAKGYRVCEPYSDAAWELREVTDSGLQRRIQRWRANRHREEWQRIKSSQTPVAADVCMFLHDQLRRCRIRADAPAEIFAPEVGVAVDRIRRGDWFFCVDRFGRIHTNLANLKRELRPYLLVDGQRLVNVDIANSQPLFIGLVLLRAGSRRQETGRGGRGLGPIPFN